MSTEHNMATLINSNETNVMFVNTRILDNSIPPSLYDMCIHKYGPRANPYELCDPSSQAG